MTILQRVRIYDATSLLGFGVPKNDPRPEVAPGEIIIRYGGWSLRGLSHTAIGNRLMCRQDWYHRYAWSDAQFPVGSYRLHLPVPDSNRKTFDEQKAMLLATEQVAPVVLVASALLAHSIQTGEDLLNTGWVRCRETATAGRIGFDCSDGRLGIYRDYDDYRNAFVWLAAVRTL